MYKVKNIYSISPTIFIFFIKKPTVNSGFNLFRNLLQLQNVEYPSKYQTLDMHNQ